MRNFPLSETSASTTRTKGGFLLPAVLHLEIAVLGRFDRLTDLTLFTHTHRASVRRYSHRHRQGDRSAPPYLGPLTHSSDTTQSQQCQYGVGNSTVTFKMDSFKPSISPPLVPLTGAYLHGKPKTALKQP